MFLFLPIHFLTFWGKSQTQRSYKNGSHKNRVYFLSIYSFAILPKINQITVGNELKYWPFPCHGTFLKAFAVLRRRKLDK